MDGRGIESLTRSESIDSRFSSEEGNRQEVLEHSTKGWVVEENLVETSLNSRAKGRLGQDGSSRISCDDDHGREI